jgi:spermidine/putrescine-binding protein
MASPGSSESEKEEQEERRFSRRDVVKIGVFTAAGAAVGGALGFLGGSGSRQQEIDTLTARVRDYERVLNLPPLSPSISMYNWSLYTNYALLDEFESKFKVQMTYDDSAQTQEDFRSRLQLGNPDGFDIMIVTGYAVEEAIGLGLLERLNHDYIPNIEQLDPSYQTPWDPNHEYSLPYLWGTTGLGWNTLLTQFPAGQTTLNSWDQIFNTSPGGFLDLNRGRVTIQADRDEALAATAIWLQSQGVGTGVNDLSQSTLDAVKQALIDVKPMLAQFADAERYWGGLSGDPPDFYVSHAWSGDVLFIRESTPKPEIMYTIPDEGALLWTDNYVIPKNAPNKDTAMAFINYMWEASNTAILAMFRNYGIAQKTALYGGPKSQEQYNINEEPPGMILPYVWGLPDYNILVSTPPDPRAAKLPSLRARTPEENSRLAAIWDEIQAA